MTDRDFDNGIRPSASGQHLDPEVVSAVVDGAVPLDDRKRVEQHLIACAACRAAVEETRLLVASLQALPLPRAPRSFQLPPEAAFALESWWRRVGLRLLPALPALRAGTVAAALLLTVVTASDLFQEDEQQTLPRQVTIVTTDGGDAEDSVALEVTATTAALAPTVAPTERSTNVTVLPTSLPLAEVTQVASEPETAEETGKESEANSAPASADDELSETNADESLEQVELEEGNEGSNTEGSEVNDSADADSTSDEEEAALESAPAEDAESDMAADSSLAETSSDQADEAEDARSAEMATVPAMTMTPTAFPTATVRADDQPTEESIAFAAPEEASPTSAPVLAATPHVTTIVVHSPVAEVDGSPEALTDTDFTAPAVVVDDGGDGLVTHRAVQAALAALLLGLGGLAFGVGRLRRNIAG